MACDLCRAQDEAFRRLALTEHAVCLVNRRPVRAGHLLVYPRRHVLALDALTPAEAQDLLALLARCQRALGQTYPDAPPILFSQPIAHGTQPHVHLQLLPSRAHIRLLHTATHDEHTGEPRVIPAERIRPETPDDRLAALADQLRPAFEAT